jgi:type IV pilus assembly protein PilM
MARARTAPKTAVGLDIDPSHISAAEVQVNGQVTIERAATQPLDPGLMRDGEVTDAEGLAEALKAFFAEHKLNKRVRLGVANQRIVMRTLDMPPLGDSKELEAAVRFQAQEHIPMPLDQAVIDFHPLGTVETEAGERARVVLVAARRDMIERLLTAARRAGLRPEGIDLSAFAMIRALDVRPSTEGSAVLFVNAAGMTNMAVADGVACRFTRVVAGGLEGIVADLAARRQLTLEHARQWLQHVGLEEPVEAIDGDATIVADTRTVLADGARRVADEIRNSLDYYRGQEGALEVERAILTGPGVTIGGFANQLAAELGMPVETGVVGEAAPGALSGLDAGRLTVAAGLAVEERSA